MAYQQSATVSVIIIQVTPKNTCDKNWIEMDWLQRYNMFHPSSLQKNMLQFSDWEIYPKLHHFKHTNLKRMMFYKVP